MSAEQVRVWVPGPVASPRGARWAASVALWITHILRGAQGLMRRLAAGGQPQNANELLAHARQIEPDMPGLASDLQAAALRHGQTQA